MNVPERADPEPEREEVRQEPRTVDADRMVADGIEEDRLRGDCGASRRLGIGIGGEPRSAVGERGAERRGAACDLRRTGGRRGRAVGEGRGPIRRLLRAARELPGLRGRTLRARGDLPCPGGEGGEAPSRSTWSRRAGRHPRRAARRSRRTARRTSRRSLQRGSRGPDLSCVAPDSAELAPVATVLAPEASVPSPAPSRVAPDATCAVPSSRLAAPEATFAVPSWRSDAPSASVEPPSAACPSWVASVPNDV